MESFLDCTGGLVSVCPRAQKSVCSSRAQIRSSQYSQQHSETAEKISYIPSLDFSKLRRECLEEDEEEETAEAKLQICKPARGVAAADEVYIEALF